ncbi:shikimate 5-dehydrogenase [Wohlfahrtiimonas chitiniclastica]|uniref:shikimate 5-dehydrogenase n=1 Tax=Wohlfahrtiimonas chitiniclastica TaxID=400946 RepID=UPI000B985B0C|nr:shikimate 5-dehydrogenase [Wohlfahrtiimonas chitiniclastica]OYQ71601.1 shikimate 5-dehydrogenase [Wohlfahrtiimonas chitiniclastica]OYQ82557.1 shikimate 5-dehydrogenase [Wohlfahrtiimonas chitiniclastica]OYQ85504.1 shikimate 5-dehydrogenase [Wohlfahrtiimonas chitiniclastica]OYQ86260.1 shikimate 5-dehydrogenase [Wohlfahrtiimonas chitiniclastica]
MITKQTQLCMSLAARPGNFGTLFHNYLYDQLKLDYIYKAFTTSDLPAAIGGVRALGIRGCAISMPFKEAVIELVDELDQSAAAIESVNTIVNTDGHLTAYNTDYIAVANLLQDYAIDPATPFLLKGSGGMAKAVAGALYDQGFKRGTIIARNAVKGKALADLYGYEWMDDEEIIASTEGMMLINVTPLGMQGGKEADALAFSPIHIETAETIFDVVALPVETPMIQLARTLNKTIISGADVAVIQALEQFVLYTGVRPSIDLIKEASNFARSHA